VSSFDNVRHDVLLGKIARRVQDPKVLHLVKLILKVGGKKGVPQGVNCVTAQLARAAYVGRTPGIDMFDVALERGRRLGNARVIESSL
jgi:hypothetical protein